MQEQFGEVIALDFDFASTARLRIFDAELEMLRLEAMSVGALSQSFGAQKQSGPLNGTRVGEITSANFRDQGF